MKVTNNIGLDLMYIRQNFNQLNQPKLPETIELEFEEVIPEGITFGMYGNEEPPTELRIKTTTSTEEGDEIIIKVLKQ